jgi:hypothetical protein
MGATGSLIIELETAMEGGSRETRIETLRRVTDSLLAAADGSHNERVDLFDDFLCRLIKRIENEVSASCSSHRSTMLYRDHSGRQKMADDLTAASHQREW